MRVILQRVSHASVQVDAQEISSIKKGLLLFVGIEEEDTQEDIDWLCAKIVNLRIFEDQQGVMNNSVKQVDGALLLVSQFTLHAAIKKGNRPSYSKAAKPDFAIPMYDKMIKKMEEELGKPIETGKFGADMQVSLCNDGPVTIWIDSKNKE